MGLAGWNNVNKLKLTIDSSKIDDTLLQGNSTDKTQCTASSEYSGDYLAGEAWDGIADGSTTNAWISGNGCVNPDGSCWLQWNFGVERDILCWRFHTRGNAGADIWPSNVKILGSNTGAFGGEEVTLYDDDVPGASGMSPDEWSVWMEFTAHGCYQYLRIEIHESYIFDPGATWVSVQEVEFKYGIVDFPVLITLSSGSGQTSVDTTCVFNELTTVSGSYVNRKKIAVTTTISGVETELYVEIDRWDDAASPGNEQAWLWTKVPTLVSGTDTNLYLYYDSAHTANSEHVGDTGETPAQNVWDSDFAGVWHMAQDPSGGAGCILDSTSNSNNFTPEGSMASDDLIDGVIGKCLDFDGGNDNLIDGGAFVMSDTPTVEVIHNGTEISYITILEQRQDSGVGGRFLSLRSTSFGIYTGGIAYSTGGDMTYVAGTKDGDNYVLYLNGVYDDDSIISSDSTLATHNPLTIAARTKDTDARGDWADADIDEVRISDIHRSSSWIKATYYSNWDDLITYEVISLNFAFINPVPTHLSTVYGVAHTLQLTTTVSGPEPSYVYSAVFYDALDDSQIGSTVFGVSSGQPASATMQTPSGIDYSWYLIATSSGQDGPSSTYTFTNKFLCSGTTEVDSVLTADIPVRLYRRSNGVLIGSTTSISGGLFEIESTYNENHYAIAIHPTDSGTNALIYDWLTP